MKRFATDGYDLLLAITHGGQIRMPFGPAIVTNCGLDRAGPLAAPWDDDMSFHVCAGLGTNPYARSASVPPRGDRYSRCPAR